MKIELILIALLLLIVTGTIVKKYLYKNENFDNNIYYITTEKKKRKKKERKNCNYCKNKDMERWQVYHEPGRNQYRDMEWFKQAPKMRIVSNKLKCEKKN